MTEGQNNTLAVVHLAVKSYGEDALAAFARSYRDHPAGRPHDLLIAAKQFADVEDFAPFARHLDGIPYRLLLMPDEGFDLGTYFAVGRSQPYRQYCFLNSLSEILVDNWLDKLVTALESAPGGMAGVTGSWCSVSSGVRYMHYEGIPKALQNLRGILGFCHIVTKFPPFPNPHLRTNGFVIERETMLALKLPKLRTKADTFRFESGWGNLTSQLLKMGRKVLVVDADGRAHDVADWASSGTFWTGDQPGLLVSDKQTRQYAEGDDALRRRLHDIAWIKPAPPPR